MNPGDRASVLAGLEALKEVAARVPDVAPFANIALNIAMDVIESEHEDPLAVLVQARTDLLDVVSKAMKAKFPNG